MRKHILSLLSGAGVLAASTVSAQFTFTDNFEGATFGEDWVQYNNPGDPPGSWELQDYQADGMSAPSQIARPILGQNPPPTGYTLDKVLSYEGGALDFHPFTVSTEMVGLQTNRWAGLAFHIQGDPAADANKVSYYSLIIRTESGSDSAVQFRYYDEGNANVINTIHPIPNPEGGNFQIEVGQYYRYSVTSEEPGVFLFSIDEVDNETRDVVRNITTFSESHNALSGGFGGLHANSDNVGYDNFTVVPEPSTVAVILGAACFGVALLVRRRKRAA